MQRPMPLRLAPGRLREWLYYSFYHERHADWPDLFAAAPLALTPRVSMFDLLPGDAISGSVAFTGFYELPLSKQILQLAQKGGLFVDVGANMGYFSLLWAGAKETNRVIAFEASPRNIALFENNNRQNKLSDRITLIPKAAGDRSGVISFDVGPSAQTGWGGISSTSSSTTIDVPLVRLDQELPDTHIDVLKIDVEGADTWVLRGCEDLLRKKQIGTIFFEQNKDRMSRLGIKEGEAVTFLTDLHYKCSALSQDAEQWVACLAA